MSDRARELLNAIQRPLTFLRDGGPRKYASVRNLSEHVLGASKEALCLGLPDGELQIFQSLQELFSGFDRLPVVEKRDRVEKGLNLLSPQSGAGKKVGQFRSEEHLLPSVEKLESAHRELSRGVRFLKGVGPVVAEKLMRADIKTIYDLLLFAPIRYEDRRYPVKISDLTSGRFQTTQGEVVFSGIAYYRGLRRKIFEAVLRDGTSDLKLKWFRIPGNYLAERIRRGRRIIACGKVTSYRGGLEMHHPDFEMISAEADSGSFGKIAPVYREVGGIYQKTLRRWLADAVSRYVHLRTCVVPADICERQDLMPPWRALRDIHLPTEMPPQSDDRSEAERSLSFEELFFYCLSLVARKQLLRSHPGIAFLGPTPTLDRFEGIRPYRLTEAQEKVFGEIRRDMAAPKPMNRLLQGDVGSGKTVVAFQAALIAIDHGRQVAFMAPTEILADQHFRTLSGWGEKLGIKVDLMEGKLPDALRKERLRAIAAGEVDIVVGTHAVLEKDVHFSSLGLVVVDEQHRFGVRQRAVLRGKGLEPDVLVMSATPIPRTLALTLYGDLDVSLLLQLPKGRKPIETRVFGERDRAKVYERIHAEAKKGRQAYVVYPLVSESDQIDARHATGMAEELKKNIFPDLRVGLVHGQMPSLEKETEMTRFERGETQVLVSTTVIEVGIDVPNASVMVIEHPERFGLAQLHQLRGRVGRGSEQSYCWLIRGANISTLARKRLETFSQVHDGFLLAEEDLKLRGPGDFFGVAQSGFPNFRVAVFPRDLDILESARREALKLLESDPPLAKPGHRHLKWVMDHVWENRLSLVRVG